MTLEQFKNETLNKSYGNPKTNTYVGECVSYVRQYMEQVLGIKTAVWGNAVDYWTNPQVLQYFNKVSSPKDGDIVVYGDDPGNWTGPAGHIAIYYKGQLLNQNYNNSRKVTINPMFSPGRLGYLRKKDMAEKVDLDTARRLAYSILGDKTALTGKRDADLKKNHVGHTLDAAYIAGLFESPEAKLARSKGSGAPASSADKQLAAIKAALKTLKNVV